MKQQSPITLFFLILFTFGIYGIVWLARTRGEMVRLGADIPTTWLVIIPFVNIWYIWKWSQGVELVTKGKMQGVIAFLLQFLLGTIGSAIIQDSFNKVGEASAAAPAPVGPAPGAESDQSAPTDQQ